LHRTTTALDGLVTLFMPARRTWLALLALAGLSVTSALSLRYGLIENAPLGRACDASGGSFVCALRQTTIVLFNHDVFGGLALALAALNLWRPTVPATASALIAAGLGLTLYNTAAAAFACGLIVLAFARPSDATTLPPAN
jgi:hypothetical protein